MMDAKGIDQVLFHVHKWFKDFSDIKYEIKSSQRDGLTVYSLWLMTFRIKKMPKKLWKLDGMSHITLTEDGKVLSSTDYWDASPFFAAFPILGSVINLIKKLMK